MKQLGEDELAVYHVIAEHGEVTAEEVSFGAEMTMGKVQGILTVLEMKGLIVDLYESEWDSAIDTLKKFHSGELRIKVNKE